MRPYVRPMPFAWWARSRPYTLFVIRELTSVFIAAYLAVLLIFLNRLAAGREVYEAYLRTLAAPSLMVFHLVALAAAIYHSITWFKLAPMAVPLRVQGKRVPEASILVVNYTLWAVVSLVIAWLVWRG